MAVFSAIATFIVTGSFAAVTAFTAAWFAVQVIAAGLAIATARALTPGLRGGAGGRDQGVRLQLPPATENKVPVIYGYVFQQGIVTDAHLTSSDNETNDTMTYVITIGEKTQTGNWTLHNVYWNDQRLVFKGDGTTVAYGVPLDGENNTNLDGLVKVWMYAGGSGSAFNISVAGGPVPSVNAYDIIPNVDNTYLMSDLIFAVIQVKYDGEKGVTGLPTITFEIENSLKNPGNVIYDYLTAERYGCGLSANSINTATLFGSTSTATCLAAWSDTIPDNQFEQDGTTPSTQPRYEINGVLNTGDVLKANLDRLTIASSSWLIFDGKQGEWKVVLNKQATQEQLDAAMLFDDDNIIGEITLTSTNLEDLYNQIEIQYPNRNSRDQSDFYKAEIDSSDRNQLEEDNILRMRVDMANSKIHAGRIGNITLRQTRIDLVIQFQADYEALQVEAGDIIKVTNPIYDFTEKLFRVMKVRETEGEDGVLACEITALEYNASVYTDLELVDGEDKPASNIPPADSSESLPPPSAPLISNINNSANTPNFTLATTLSTGTNPVSIVEWFYSDNTATNFIWLDNSISAGSYAGNETVTDIITNLVEAGTWYFKARTGVGGLYSNLSDVSAALVWDPQPAGANDGTINSSTQSVNLFVNSVSSGQYALALTTGTNDYVPFSSDPQFNVDVAANKMYIGPWEVSTNTGAIYVEYLSTTTAALVATTASQAVTFTELATGAGLQAINTTTLVSPSTGTYYVSWRAQFGNGENNVTHRARMWLRENGVDVPRTTTTISIPGAHGGSDGFAILTTVVIIFADKDDEYELYWSAEDLDVSLEASAAGTTPVYPTAPAVVLTAYKLAGGYG